MANNDPLDEQFLRIFVQHEDDLRAYARALLPNWEAASEVMQEASVVMWRKMNQLRDESEFLPWAKVIVRFEALKARQSVARDRLCFGDDVFELLADEEEAESPEQLIRERQALSDCLEKLSSPERKLLLLPYQGHGRVMDLAAESSRTVNSLYKKIGRLRQKITRCVELQMANPRTESGLL